MNHKKRIAKVLLPNATKEAYDYLISSDDLSDYRVGDFVIVPLGRRTSKGVIIEITDHSLIDTQKLKCIESIVPLPSLSETLLKFIHWVAQYTSNYHGMVLKMVMSVKEALEKPELGSITEQTFPHLAESRVNLSEQQLAASVKMCRALDALEEDSAKIFLLDGVTGSGKTEVYLEVAKKALMQGKQVLILLPEIALSEQLLIRFENYFGSKPIVWNSGLTPARRRENWKAIIYGQARLIVGARSALFLPYHNLGLIIVDEEHDQSYKQEEGVIYHARDMAVMRGKYEKIPVILVSATPSVESYENARSGKYIKIALENRHGSAGLPDIQIVDMKKQKIPSGSWISDILHEQIKKNISDKKQSLLFLNRRGYAPLTICRTCGEKIGCPNCDTTLVLHKGRGILLCHHCGYIMSKPSNCPSCESDALVESGPGVERLEAEVMALFPDAKIQVMTSDTIQNSSNAKELINKMISGEVDILIGTQMIVKGYHFPKLTLVGVIDADMGLSGTDLRASERTYQMLHQVAGRSGREDEKGLAVIQTYYPEHPVIQSIISGERDKFLEAELDARKNAKMPPFLRLASVIISGKTQEESKAFSNLLSTKIPRAENIKVMGPAPATIAYLRGRYRFRFLIVAEKRFNVQKYIKDWLSSVVTPPSIMVRTDIDPYSFY